MGLLSLWEALLLGVVQGVSEWLPISSSAHLVMAQELLGIPVPVFYDLVLHMGTLLAVLVVYRERLTGIAFALAGLPADARRAGWSRALWGHPDRRLGVLLFVGTLPIVAVGFLLEARVDAAFEDLRLTGFALVLTGLWLLSTRLARTRQERLRDMGPLQALAVGVAQACAVFPGISRSGATMGAAIHAGVERSKAADFSFLLSVPALFGALVLKADEARHVQDVGVAAAVVGFLVSFVVGYASLRWLLAVVRRWGLLPFAPYCLLVGAALVVGTYR